MKHGQMAQIRELSRCHMATSRDEYWLEWLTEEFVYLPKYARQQLRRLWHQYRHQIAAMRKNRQL